MRELGFPPAARVAAAALAAAGIGGALLLWSERGVALWLDAVLAFCG